MSFLQSLTVWDMMVAVVDIGVVSYVFYRLFMLIRGTRAVQLIKGIIVLVVATFASQYLGLREVNWLLKRVMEALIVAIPVVFQPELRRALEQLGRGRLFTPAPSPEVLDEESRNRLIDELLRATEMLSKNKVGALLVLERETGLNDYIETGIKIDGLVSAEFLINIFIPNTPLHDGAVVVRGNRVLAAACFLPLTDQGGLPTELGSRHRAALGISEQSDALALVVSEETGAVSLGSAGKLIRSLDSRTLREMLTAQLTLRSGVSGFKGLWQRGTV